MDSIVKEKSNTKKAFGKDFILVIIGQIISLFGNQILRYALPLYLLNETKSAFLFGATMAISFVPMFVLVPVGGIVADRVNKRNIMVALDFCTAALVAVYSITYGSMNVIAVTIIMLILLYGIQGLYQPAVQASVPILVPRESLTQGNAMINMVGSLAGILGPVIGGMTYVKFGFGTILVTSIVCFVLSAVMEIFIKIPYSKPQTSGSIVSIVKGDMKDGIGFITKKRPEIGRVGILLLVINLVFSALIVVGLPVLVKGQLGFDAGISDKLYGYAQGALALGGLLGGMFAGIAGKKLDVKKGAGILLGCTLTIFPIALCLQFKVQGYVTYFVTVACCVLMMIFSTILTVLLVTYVQMVTPKEMLGKVMALLTCLVMCGHPVGQLLYGLLLEKFSSCMAVIFEVVFVVAGIVTLVSGKIFRNLKL